MNVFLKNYATFKNKMETKYDVLKLFPLRKILLVYIYCYS